MNDNPIGDSGARLFARLLISNTTIIYLHLRDCDIGDEGARALAAVKNINLNLNLGGNNIGVEGRARSRQP
jgi:hypothetical protein